LPNRHKHSMKTHTEHIDQWTLIAKQLSGEATNQEIEQLTTWLGDSESNSADYATAAQVWKVTEHAYEPVIVDNERAWSNIELHIQASQPKTVGLMPLKANTNRGFKFYAWRVAATIILLLGVTSLINLIFNAKSEKIVATNQTETNVMHLLPDGSKVFLNSNSEIRYPSKFDDAKREIYLTGEAYFEIKRDTLKPFIVRTSTTQIKVLGTSFNVDASLRNGKVEVVVAEGKVSFGKKQKNEVDTTGIVILVKGSKGVFSEKENTLVKTSNADENYLAWRTKRLVFNETELSQVLYTLGKVYNTDFVVKDSTLRICKLTATFDNHKLETIIEVLKTAFNIEIERNGSTIILRGKGC